MNAINQMERRERRENHERSGEQSHPGAWATERYNKENHTDEAVAYSTDNLHAETLTGKSTEESHPDKTEREKRGQETEAGCNEVNQCETCEYVSYFFNNLF